MCVNDLCDMHSRSEQTNFQSTISEPKTHRTDVPRCRCPGRQSNRIVLVSTNIVQPPGDRTPAIDRLVRSARECYRRDGVRSTRMADIAAGAGVARQTAYASVKGRYHLLELAIEARIFELSETIRKVDFQQGMPVQDRIVATLATMVAVAGGDPEFTTLTEALPRQRALQFMAGPSALTDVVVDLLRPLATEARHAGLMRTDVSFYEIATWMQTVLAPLAARQPLDQDELRRTLRLFLLPALLGPERG
jgi:AcrR family transcriptional regulator